MHIFYVNFKFFLVHKHLQTIIRCIEDNNWYFHIRTASLRNIWSAPHLFRFLFSRRMISDQWSRWYHIQNLKQKQNHKLHFVYWNQYKWQGKMPWSKTCLYLHIVTNPQLVLHTLIELACLLASIAYTFKKYANFFASKHK